METVSKNSGGKTEQKHRNAIDMTGLGTGMTKSQAYLEIRVHFKGLWYTPSEPSLMSIEYNYILNILICLLMLKNRSFREMSI